MKRGLLICLVVLAVLLLPTLASGAKSGWSDQGSGSPAGTSETWQCSASSDVGGNRYARRPPDALAGIAPQHGAVRNFERTGKNESFVR